MIFQVTSVFVDVVLPVFCLVAIAYVAGPRLKLDVHTLSKTAYYILIPAVLFSAGDISQPLLLTRVVGLLGKAMIPIMLLILGLQLANASRLKITREVAVAALLRLVAGPAVDFVKVAPTFITTTVFFSTICSLFSLTLLLSLL